MVRRQPRPIRWRELGVTIVCIVAVFMAIGACLIITMALVVGHY